MAVGIISPSSSPLVSVFSFGKIRLYSPVAFIHLVKEHHNKKTSIQSFENIYVCRGVFHAPVGHIEYVVMPFRLKNTAGLLKLKLPLKNLSLSLLLSQFWVSLTCVFIVETDTSDTQVEVPKQEAASLCLLLMSSVSIQAERWELGASGY